MLMSLLTSTASWFIRGLKRSVSSDSPWKTESREGKRALPELINIARKASEQQHYEIAYIVSNEKSSKSRLPPIIDAVSLYQNKLGLDYQLTEGYKRWSFHVDSETFGKKWEKPDGNTPWLRSSSKDVFKCLWQSMSNFQLFTSYPISFRSS